MAPMSVVDLIPFAKRDSLVQDQIQPVQNSSTTSSDADSSGRLTTLSGTLYIGPIASILVLILFLM
jgi:hypothetical protein